MAALARLWALDRVPPGLWFDEAVNAQDALAVWRGAHPIFFEGNLGREPLYMYLLAPFVGWLGPGVVPIRILSAALGLLTVVAIYPLAAALFDRPVALYATAAAAVSYPLLHFSRTGFRVITLPLAIVLAVWLTWSGLRRDRAWLVAAGGVLFGLSFYTYSASRYTTPPLVLLLALLALTRAAGRSPRRRLGLAALLVGLAGLVALPLGLYFQAHPDVLFFRSDRMDFINPLAGRGAARAYLGSLVDLARMFAISGDGLARHNLPGRPLLDPLMAAAGLLGLVALLDRRWRLAGALALAWIAAALGPLSFTLDNPHHLRALVAVPAICLIVGLGLASLRDWLGRGLGPVPASALCLGLVGLAGGLTARDYFVTWPAQPATYWATQADVRAAADLLPTLPPGEPIYLAADEYRERPEPFTALVGERDDVHAFNGRKALVFPRESAGSVVYLLPESGTERWDRIAGFLPESSLLQRVVGPEARDALRVYRLPADQVRPRPSRALAARFGDTVDLLGYDLRAASAGDLALTLYWRIREHRWYPWEWRATPVDAALNPLAPPALSDSLVANAWRVGDVVASWLAVPRPVDPRADIVYVALGMLDRGEADRVRIADPTGRDVGTYLRLGPVKLGPRPTGGVPADLVPVGARFGGQIELIGYRLEPAAPRPGGELAVTLAWRALEPIDADYTVFVQLLDRDGQLRAQQDAPPLDGRMPTSVWQPGETVVDTARLRLPPELAGPPTLIVGLYAYPSLRRLPVTAADPRAASDHVRIGL